MLILNKYYLIKHIHLVFRDKKTGLSAEMVLYGLISQHVLHLFPSFMLLQIILNDTEYELAITYVVKWGGKHSTTHVY